MMTLGLTRGHLAQALSMQNGWCSPRIPALPRSPALLCHPCERRMHQPTSAQPLQPSQPPGEWGRVAQEEDLCEGTACS